MRPRYWVPWAAEVVAVGSLTWSFVLGPTLWTYLNLVLVIACCGFIALSQHRMRGHERAAAQIIERATVSAELTAGLTDDDWADLAKAGWEPALDRQRRVESRAAEIAAVQAAQRAVRPSRRRSPRGRPLTSLTDCSAEWARILDERARRPLPMDLGGWSDRRGLRAGWWEETDPAKWIEYGAPTWNWRCSCGNASGRGFTNERLAKAAAELHLRRDHR